jgi:hypothetical protein
VAPASCARRLSDSSTNVVSTMTCSGRLLVMISGLDPAYPRHLDIHQNDVGHELLRKLDPPGAVGSLSHDRDALCLKQLSKRLAAFDAVVHELPTAGDLYDWSPAAQVLSDARTIRAVPLVGSIRV